MERQGGGNAGEGAGTGERGRGGAEGCGEVRGSMRESWEMWESGEGRGRSGGRCEGCGGGCEGAI